MNAISDFFGKYHAVRADSVGPKWSTTPETTLLDWYSTYRGIVRCGWHKTQQREATAAERASLKPILLEIEAEILRRDTFANRSPDIFAAACMVRHSQREGK